MKKLTQIIIGVGIVAMLACSAHKSNTKDNTATQTNISGYTKQVTNADLYKFLEANQHNPSLNAVKMKVADVENILRGFSSTGEVYITIADTKEAGRNIAVIGPVGAEGIRICTPKCCPPPAPCDLEGIINIQFVNPDIFYDPAKKLKTKKSL